ncbi:class I SAM-dependent methyltransferase [Mycolicibacterium gilvum]|uniref:Methyltransferase family protein n=1 Tax=Mycolicibacterium gilvum (strain DSM 45189 / LMG 24558 / Spyr1) TaxID=278137 RepID=E6TBM2_MYCSR|nr:class I SAM-dependent methyltransferase [Mycolicibacterium gilvum]ADU00734.1 methyltransferase family protein [Mycolicibacterium gilvum Spyr1]
MLPKEPVESYHDLVRHDVSSVIPENVGRILDFGGGIGATSVALKRKGRATYVVVADQVGGQLSEVDRAYRGNLEDEDFISKVVNESGPFDCILLLDILEHLYDPWRTVRQLHDALVPNGTIIASIPNVNYHGLLMPLFLRGRYVLQDSGILDRTHIRWFARHGAVELMSSPGLAVEHVSPNIFTKRERRLNQLSFGKLGRFVALQYVIRARRVD